MKQSVLLEIQGKTVEEALIIAANIPGFELHSHSNLTTSLGDSVIVPGTLSEEVNVEGVKVWRNSKVEPLT